MKFLNVYITSVSLKPLNAEWYKKKKNKCYVLNTIIVFKSRVTLDIETSTIYKLHISKHNLDINFPFKPILNTQNYRHLTMTSNFQAKSGSFQRLARAPYRREASPGSHQIQRKSKETWDLALGPCCIPLPQANHNQATPDRDSLTQPPGWSPTETHRVIVTALSKIKGKYEESLARQSNGLCKYTEIKDKSSKVTYPNKALRGVTMMPSYHEIVM